MSQPDRDKQSNAARRLLEALQDAERFEGAAVLVRCDDLRAVLNAAGYSQ